jgi:hypothetical protein
VYPRQARSTGEPPESRAALHMPRCSSGIRLPPCPARCSADGAGAAPSPAHGRGAQRPALALKAPAPAGWQAGRAVLLWAGCRGPGDGRSGMGGGELAGPQGGSNRRLRVPKPSWTQGRTYSTRPGSRASGSGTAGSTCSRTASAGRRSRCGTAGCCRSAGSGAGRRSRPCVGHWGRWSGNCCWPWPPEDPSCRRLRDCRLQTRARAERRPSEPAGAARMTGV